MGQVPLTREKAEVALYRTYLQGLRMQIQRDEHTDESLP